VGEVKKEAEAFFTILQGVDEGRFIVIGPSVIETEIEKIKGEDKREAALRLLARASQERVDSVSLTKQREIKETTGVKDWDAFHLAAAIDAKARFFITVDKYILRRAKALEKFGIKTRDPVKFLEEVKYEQRG
jgi:predicted nucleic acid-binding protein